MKRMKFLPVGATRFALASWSSLETVSPAIHDDESVAHISLFSHNV